MRVFDESSANKIFTIPPGVGFLDILAQTLVSEFDLENKPDALARTLIYVPNGRSAISLAKALHEAVGKKAIIAPEIRGLGNVEEDEPLNVAEAHLAPIAPTISNAERVGTLAKLCIPYLKALGTDSPVAAINCAREVAGLIDQAIISGEIDWNKLTDIEVDVDLAEHWSKALTFLKIIIEAWPNHLKEKDCTDRHDRRLAVAKAVAKGWAENPPDFHVIIAGSTGSTKVSRVLMTAAVKLPLGRVILPGLDSEASLDTWNSIRNSPGHPQFAFVQTLQDLVGELEKVETIQSWPKEVSQITNRARRLLINESLAPPDKTADWLSRVKDLALKEKKEVDVFAKEALRGLTLIEARDEVDEARIASLILRETLEHKDQNAVLVTNDPTLERRTVANLKRWNVCVQPAGGISLLNTPSGAFADLVLDWLRDPSCPVKIASLCKHKFFADHIEEKDEWLDFNRFEREFLRGIRQWNTLSEMRKCYEKDPKRQLRNVSQESKRQTNFAVFRLIDLLEKASTFDGVSFLDNEIGSLLAFCEKWVDSMQTLLGNDSTVWKGRDGSKLATVIEELSEILACIGDGTAEHLREIYRDMAKEQKCREPNYHPNIEIWRAMEARLQSANKVVLAGLNEGVWPRQATPGSFLPRQFYDQLGMSDPEHRLGLTAHDFSQLACAPNVTLIYTRRRDGSPAVASRWIWRLRTLAEGALTKEGAAQSLQPAPESNPVEWAKCLTKLGKQEEADFAIPKPRPPLEARPEKLSVTRINVLQRDPYAIYAENVLKLVPLDPLDAAIDARPIGTAVHKALERFEENDKNKAKDREWLLQLMREEFELAGVPESRIRQLWAVRRNACDGYLQWQSEQDLETETVGVELRGKWKLVLSNGREFTVSGQADRIDKLKDGTFAIYDFKTGDPPSEPQIDAGLEQQMPLLALIASEGEIEGLRQTKVSKLGYIKVGTKFAVKIIGESSNSPFADVPVSEIMDRTRKGLKKLLDSYSLTGDHAYLSAPRVKWIKHDFGFNRLARRDEWVWKTDSSGSEGQSAER